MIRPPIRMTTHERADLRCDGKWLQSARASFVWETFLLRRAAGIPGDHEIRRGRSGRWYLVSCTIEEAEEALAASKLFGQAKVLRSRRIRQRRIERGLPVE